MSWEADAMPSAYSIEVRGVVQGVGFRPFIYRLARAHGLTGWVLNAVEGVRIHAEGEPAALEAFAAEIKTHAPQAAKISAVRVETTAPGQFPEFVIRESAGGAKPSVRISPDLPTCQDCLGELSDPQNLRYRYPYINCTNCGPRYSVIRSLPYDRPNTTMAAWPLDELCASEYSDPVNRRFHAQPVACGNCGPHYYFRVGDEVVRHDAAAIRQAVEFLQAGRVLAVKGLAATTSSATPEMPKQFWPCEFESTAKKNRSR